MSVPRLWALVAHAVHLQIGIVPDVQRELRPLFEAWFNSCCGRYDFDVRFDLCYFDNAKALTSVRRWGQRGDVDMARKTRPLHFKP